MGRDIMQEVTTYFSLVNSSLQLQSSNISPLQTHVACDFFVISRYSLGREALAAVREGDAACVEHVIGVDSTTSVYRSDEDNVLGSCPLLLCICIRGLGQETSKYTPGA